MSRIGIDIGDLAMGRTGVSGVTLEILRYLSENDQENQYFLYQNDDAVYVAPGQFERRFANLPLYSFVREQLYFSARSLLDRLDVFHAPIHLPPFVRPRKTKCVLSVYDLNAELASELYPPALCRYNIPRRKKAIESVDVIIVNSEFVKKSVLEYCEIPEEKVKLIPLGVQERFFHSQEEAAKEEVRKRYQLPDRFILFVGSVEPWKRVSLLIERYLAYQEEAKSDCDLVIVGQKGWQPEEVMKVESACHENANIHWLGFVAKEDLPTIYQLAKVFTTASQWEGFGMILLEAMAAGIPVLAANEASMPEVMGKAGETFEVASAYDFGEKLDRLLQDAAFYELKKEAGVQRAREFSWEKFGKGVLDVYRSLN